MKVRKVILSMISVAVLMTGFLGYTYGHEVDPGDWRNRGIYTDELRSLWWPLFVGLVVLLILMVARMRKDNQDDRGGAMALN